MAYDREASLRDQAKINEISKGADFTNAYDVERVFKIIQSGSVEFESDYGRRFDDKIYDLHEKVLSGEIPYIEDETVKKGLFSKSTSKRSSDLQNKGATKENSANRKNVSNRNNSNRNNSNRNNPKRSALNDDTDNKDSKKIEDKYGDSINALVELELKKRERKRKLLIVLAGIVAIASLGYFGFYYYNSSKTVNDYQSLAALKGSDVLSGNNNKRKPFSLHKQEVVLPDVLEEYETLLAKNNHMIGWLKILGTNIDYPVMQTDDNDYYLSHNFNNEPDNNGSLFLDCECSVFPKSTNMIIYGHHMKSGNMFGYLQKFSKESYWEQHKTIQFDTIYERGTYEIMYVFYSKVYDNDELVFKYYQFINANSENEFDYYMNEMKSLSLYDTGVTAKYGDTLLTLSTCDHSQTDGRFAVVARKVR